MFLQGPSGAGKDFLTKMFLQKMKEINNGFDYLHVTAQQDIPLIEQQTKIEDSVNGYRYFGIRNKYCM